MTLGAIETQAVNRTWAASRAVWRLVDDVQSIQDLDNLGMVPDTSAAYFTS